MVSPVVKQSWVVSGVLLSVLAQGILLRYPSYMIPGMMRDGSPFQDVDIDTLIWLASSAWLAAIPGYFVSAFLMEKLGRRIAHALVLLPGLTSWLVIYFSINVTTVIIGLILGGITAGATATLGAIVIGEYTSPGHRGMFLNFKTAAVFLGHTITHVLGYNFHWKTVALFGMVPHILAFIIVCTWPESPAWLALKKQYIKSETAFDWLRGHDSKSQRELQDMLKVQKERLNSQYQHTCGGEIKNFFLKFTRKDFLKPVMIVLLGGILLGSSEVLPAFGPTIIHDIMHGMSETQIFYCSLILGLIFTASTLLSSALVKIVKRRTLLFSTGLAALVIFIIFCGSLYVVKHVENTFIYAKWVLLPFVAYCVLVSLGCSTIPYTFLGEVFPLPHRSVGSVVSGITFNLSLLIVYWDTDLLFSIGNYRTFAIFGGVMAASLCGLYIILPETKDRTLQEIEDYFTYGKFTDEVDDKETEMVKINSK